MKHIKSVFVSDTISLHCRLIVSETNKLFRPKTKRAETVQIVVFGAETETEFRSVSSLQRNIHVRRN